MRTDACCPSAMLTGRFRGRKIKSCHSWIPRHRRQSAAGPIGHCNTALSLSAGVSNPKVFLGRWFRRNAILFKYAWEISSLGEVLAQQAIGVFVAAALPG